MYHTGFPIDQYVGQGELQRGSNLILVKLCQNDQKEDWAQAWAFRLRSLRLARDGGTSEKSRVIRRRMRMNRRVARAQSTFDFSKQRKAIHSYVLGVFASWRFVDRCGSSHGRNDCADWRGFRGDGGSVAARQRPPAKWNAETGENVAWKITPPGRGVSGPIVVGDNVIVTSSNGPREGRLHVSCFDAVTGKERWGRQFWATGSTLCHPMSAVACNTPVSDGERIYAQFSSNDLVCLDLSGNLIWFRGLNFDYPAARHDAGMASSPVVVGDTLVVQVESQGESFAAGLDKYTGQDRWRLERSKATELVVAGSAAR